MDGVGLDKGLQESLNSSLIGLPSKGHYARE